MKYNSFQTPERRLLGAGPTNLYPEISKSLTKPEVGHLDPKFVEMMDEVKSMLRYLFQTKNEFTIAISAPGSAGMEASFVNLVEPGDKVIVCVNGLFGGRMVENVERIGGEAIEKM
jgi:Serine-pyruvate aminotransferase/archaeal aspartate aminotransferase